MLKTLEKVLPRWREACATHLGSIPLDLDRFPFWSRTQSIWSRTRWRVNLHFFHSLSQTSQWISKKEGLTLGAAWAAQLSPTFHICLFSPRGSAGATGTIRDPSRPSPTASVVTPPACVWSWNPAHYITASQSRLSATRLWVHDLGWFYECVAPRRCYSTLEVTVQVKGTVVDRAWYCHGQSPVTLLWVS